MHGRRIGSDAGCGGFGLVQCIDFKAELRDLEVARRQCSLSGFVRIGVLEQTDRYFRLPDGRLKQRSAPGEPIEWLFYHRPNRISPKMSTFTILSDEQARRRWGAHSLHHWLTVRKTRELWMQGAARIHLDTVVDLGNFIEFEALVSRAHDVRECHMMIAELRDCFGLVLGEPISVGYCDLVQQLEDLGLTEAG
ncbi:MAG: class IV adenylate cyclase [Planctomycetota bacterium]|jgi:adenylate cyclase class IV